MPYHHSSDINEYKLNARHSEYKIGRNVNNNGGALCDTNCVDVPYYTYNKNLTTKEDKFSFREMAKNLLFVNEHVEDGKDIDQLKKGIINNNRKKNVLQTNKGIVNNKTVTNNNRYGDKKQDYRIVAITNICKKISLSALLNQVHGGPVERVEIVRNDNNQFYKEDKLYELNKPINWKEVAIFLYFIKYEDAMNFYQYSKTGIFRVNDTYLQTILIPNVVSNNNSNNSQNQLDNIVSKLMIEDEKARRVLVFKKPIYDKKHKHTVNRKRPGYPDPTINYSEEFDVEEIKADFGKYGKLIEILPVVSRKLCFGVQYYDVRSAIKVKHILSPNKDVEGEVEEDVKEVRKGTSDATLAAVVEFDKLDEEDKVFQKKYLGWYVWYGKDPCDKSVPGV